MNTIRVQADDFDIAAEYDALAQGRSDIGAIVTFIGYVRDDSGLITLTLEHYPGMTEQEISKHVCEAETRWPLLGATIIHRIGRLAPRDRIVLVAVASMHREAAFRAAEFLMSYLKTRAPFWKQEERGSGANWIEARESDARAALRWDCP